MYKETRELTKECWDLFKVHDNYIGSLNLTLEEMLRGYELPLTDKYFDYIIAKLMSMGYTVDRLYQSDFGKTEEYMCGFYKAADRYLQSLNPSIEETMRLYEANDIETMEEIICTMSNSK